MKSRIQIIIDTTNFRPKIDANKIASGMSQLSGNARQFAEAASIATGAAALGLGWILEATVEAENERQRWAVFAQLLDDIEEER